MGRKRSGAFHRFCWGSSQASHGAPWVHAQWLSKVLPGVLTLNVEDADDVLKSQRLGSFKVLHLNIEETGVSRSSRYLSLP
jgi:hypothetical protein